MLLHASPLVVAEIELLPSQPRLPTFGSAYLYCKNLYAAPIVEPELVDNISNLIIF